MEQRIVANLWFDGIAEEAVDYYISVFPNSKTVGTAYYPMTKEERLADFQKDMPARY